VFIKSSVINASGPRAAHSLLRLWFSGWVGCEMVTPMIGPEQSPRRERQTQFKCINHFSAGQERRMLRPNGHAVLFLQ